MVGCHLKVENSSIRETASGTFTGTVYFVVDDIQFPELGWNDFLVVVLGWWISEFRRMYLEEQASGELDFMDGPFRIEITIRSDRQLALCGIHYGSGNPHVAFTSFIDAKSFGREILFAAKQTLTYIKQTFSGFYPDVEVLAIEIDRLEPDLSDFAWRQCFFS
jgi:hypothetical protein